MAAAVVIGIIAFLGYAVDKSPVPEAREAAIRCGYMVQESLFDPSSATFNPEPSTVDATKDSAGAYSVVLRVTANNPAGGSSTHLFRCTDDKDANGDWQRLEVTDVTQDQ